MTDDARLSSPAARTPGAAPYRFDLDGLRAFAIVLVVIYHVWVGRVSGGVDVFLLLSAYFMTASLVRRADAGRGVGLGSFYAKRFWRLVPAAAATIGATLITVFFVFPPSMWNAAWEQGRASLFYFQNWELALNSVDYYARDANSVTPFLHFWSLSIQMQVFLLWPLLILLCWGIARLLRRRVATVALVVFLLVFGASLAYSVITTQQNQAFAYFDTGARLWEFAIGSLLALIPASFVLPRWVAEILGWLGILAILTCGIVLDVSGGFPGYLALWPTLAAAAIILAGRARTTFTVFLGSLPLRWLGRIAYALYLVHWPLLTTWIVVTGDNPDLAQGAGIIGASFVLAIVLYYAIERPLGKWSWPSALPWRSYFATAVIVGLVAVPNYAWQLDTEYRAAAAQAAAEAAFQDDFEPTQPIDTLIPAGAALDAEWVHLDESSCSGALEPAGAMAREHCSENAGNDGDPRVIFVGDSHAEQWMGAVLPSVEAAPIKVTANLLGGCVFAPDDPDNPREQCREWNAQVYDDILQSPPAVVVMMATRAVPDSPDESLVPGLETTVETLTSVGSQVILIRDNPRFTENMYQCAEQNLADPTVCSRLKSDVLAAENPAASLAEEEGVHVIDMSSYLCPDDICPATFGDLAIYLDDNHLTWTFAERLSTTFARELELTGFAWPSA